jgi:hypothetical protein
MNKPMRISGPYAHENLVLFFLHGPSRSEPVPLTLEEALAKGKIDVKETGVVSELTIENIGDEEVFIQSGDIVKGGRQDRVLEVSFVVAGRSHVTGKSPPIPVSALCVESGRWAMRGQENARSFSASSRGLYDRNAKAMMRGSYASGRSDARVKQAYVWDRVQQSQQFLSRSLGRSVQAAASPTSLQLSLESEDLEQAQASYLERLSPLGTKEVDILGMAWAVNGRVSGAEAYPSNALFRKMFAKNLRACATEAVSGKGDGTAAAPTIELVEKFLVGAEQGEATDTELPGGVKMSTRISPGVVFSEVRRTDGAWVHRGYVAE